MKKFFSTIVILALSSVSFARILPTSNTLAQSTPDAWSVYGGGCAQNATGSTITGCEIAADFNGNLVPTVTNAQTLGSSTLYWSNVYATNVTSTYNTLGIQTTTYLATAAAIQPIGALTLVEERVGGTLVTNAYNECVSTAAVVASWVYLNVSTSAAAKAGAACSN